MTNEANESFRRGPQSALPLQRIAPRRINYRRHQTLKSNSSVKASAALPRWPQSAAPTLGEVQTHAHERVGVPPVTCQSTV